MPSDYPAGYGGAARPQTPPPGPPHEPAPHPPTARIDRSRDGGSSRSMWLGCLLGAAAVVLVLMLMGGALILLLFGAVSRGAVSFEEGVPLKELTVVKGPKSAPWVAILPVRGDLLPGALTSGRDPAMLLRSMLRTAEDDRRVEAVVLAVDSGGGAITTCDIMHRLVTDFRAASGKPVVVLMEDVAASGAYYVSCAANHIMAHPTTLTGSIGVLMMRYDAAELMDKVGVRDRSVKTGEFKNVGWPLAHKTEDEWRREDDMLGSVVGEIHERFIEIVAAGRNMPPDKVRPLADGRVYTAAQALQNGLIDAIGYRDDAIAQAEKLAGIKGESHVVIYHPQPSLREALLYGRSSPTVRLELPGAPPGYAERPMYLWAPARTGTTPDGP
jgi:protease-4